MMAEPLNFIIIGDTTGINSSPITAITMAFSTLASAILVHPMSILEQGIAPTRVMASARSGYDDRIVLEIKKAVIDAMR